MRFLLFLLFLFPAFAYSKTLYKFGEFIDVDPAVACKKFAEKTHGRTVKIVSVEDLLCKYDISKDNVWTVRGSKIEESKCRDSQEIVHLNVRNPQLGSMCYEGCTYVSAPNTGCVSVDFEVSQVGWACSWVQRATECDAPNGTYSGSSKDDKNKYKDKDGKDKDEKKDPKETPQCKDGTYDPTDPYYTKCPNRDKDGNDISNQKPPTSNITPTIGEDGGNGTGNDTNDKDGTDKDKDGQSDEDGKDKDGEEDGEDEVDLSGLKEKLPVEDISSKLKLNFNLFQTSGTCPSHSYTLRIGSVSKVFNLDYKYLCQVLHVLGYIVTIGGCLHATSIIARDS